MLRTIRRVPLITTTILSIILIASMPAFADGGIGTVKCDKDHPQPGCDIGAGSGGQNGDSTGGGNQNTGNHDSGGDGGSGSGAQCIYTPASPSADVIAALGGQPAGEGGWYFKSCVYPDGTAVDFPGPVWVAGAPPVVSAQVLARLARSRLNLPTVVVRLNPGGDQLVNLPTWLALDTASWRSQSATAAVPGVSVTATARAVKASWSMGDGGSVVCAGPGTAWQPGTDPLRSSPDCGYTYRRSSAGASGSAFAVTVTITWEVTWAGAGQSGTVPGLTTTGTVPVRVQESQAVITH
jgi:hypothetical protein